MRAIIRSKHSFPAKLKLENINKPYPTDDEILIKLYSATVTSGDNSLRKLNLIQFLIMVPVARLVFGVKNMRKRILGHEFAGVVEHVGRDVKKFKAGDQVFGTTGFKGGAHADYVCLKEDGVICTKPNNLTMDEAAAVPIGSICALIFLKKGNIQSGQKVLIYGASGSIGTYAVQLARYFGADVTGGCSAKNKKLVEELGAHKVIDYEKTDFTKSENKYDLIFDTVGKCSQFDCKKVLNKNGRFLSTHTSPVREHVSDLEFVKELIEGNYIKPVIDRTFTLENFMEAYQCVDSGHKKGNVVLKINDQ